MRDTRRITLVTRAQVGAQRDWNCTPDSSTRVIFVPTLSMLGYTLQINETEQQYDVERVIVDRTGGAAEFLDLLATLPAEFRGDALMLRTDGRAYLSAGGRGGDRVIYALTATDVDFYLRTHELVAEAMRMTA
jgi:hypothetical protein